MVDPMVLPRDLPVPEDDGGVAITCRVPWCQPVALATTDGKVGDRRRRSRRTVVYAYPWTGRPGEPLLIEDWDLIPSGARVHAGDRAASATTTRDDQAVGADAVVSGSRPRTTAYQRGACGAAGPAVPDPLGRGLALTRALRLPTFEVAGRRLLIKRQLP